MRIARLVGRITGATMAALAATALVAPAAAPPASADPPAALSTYVTDTAEVLTSSLFADVESAVDNLYNERKIRLWVVYVKDFSGMSAVNWAKMTMTKSDFGPDDALLAVATTSKAYALQVPQTATKMTSSQIDSLRRNQVEPALHGGAWAAAAVAAANGLNSDGPAASGGPTTSGGGVSWLPFAIAIGVLVLVVAAFWLLMRRRRKRRRAAELAAAQRVDPMDPNALSAVSVDTLDDLSRSIVVHVDNAVRTSDNELTLAVEEFGDKQTEPFVRAVNNAKAALAQAFNVRQQLDDAIPETPAQRRDLLTRVVLAAAKADRELEAQRDAFDKLRGLVIDAPSRLDSLTQQLVDLTARIDPSEQALAALHKEFDGAALASVDGNIGLAKERAAFADQNITRARELAARAVAGQQSDLIDGIRAAESALGQARSVLDAIDTAGSDIRRAAGGLPAAITGIQAGIDQANSQLQRPGGGPHTTELTAARDAAVAAVAAAQHNGSANPLGAVAQLTKADADLNRLLATVAEEKKTAERLSRTYDQALFTAQSRVRTVSDYIDTRRGSIGPQARTRLAEAVRQLQAALDKKTTDLPTAVAYANGASALAAEAQALANADVQAAQRSYVSSYGSGSNMGAMVGGIIIGDLLSGTLRGGIGGIGGMGGGWSSTSYGGSPGSSGGGYLGGGGRY